MALYITLSCIVHLYTNILSDWFQTNSKLQRKYFARYWNWQLFIFPPVTGLFFCMWLLKMRGHILKLGCWNLLTLVYLKERKHWFQNSLQSYPFMRAASGVNSEDEIRNWNPKSNLTLNQTSLWWLLWWHQCQAVSVPGLPLDNIEEGRHVTWIFAYLP